MSKARVSEIAIPTILKIGAGVLASLGEELHKHKLEHVVLFFGNGLIDMFGQQVFDSLKKADVEILSYQELDDVNIEAMTSIAFSISNEAQAIIGIGGGKVIDSAKYMGYLRQSPFISIPTSSSSDGFASASASLLVEGKRTSVPAAMAYGILVDTEIIKSAPEKFLYSGIGDMVSKITANYDWKYEAELGVSKINDFAVMIAKKAVNSFVRTPFSDIHEELFLTELLNSLAMSGIANEIAGSSAPTSGSEHLISHALDRIGEQPQLHGIQVGLATYLMAIVQEHRFERVKTVLTDTGFFEYCKTLKLDKELWLTAIDYAPLVKPYRHTYLHEEKYRTRAKCVLSEDPILREIF